MRILPYYDMPPKSTDKLTDSEKKKVKQANKAKANPGKSDEKAKSNLKRRIARGQIVDPTIESDKKKSDPTIESDQVIAVPKPKKTDTEKAERQKMKLLALEKEIQERQSQAQKERVRKLCESQTPSDSTAESDE